MKTLSFDQAVPDALDVLRQRFAERPVETTLIRTSLGTLTVVLPDETLSEADEWVRLATDLNKTLGRYSPGEKRVLLRVSDLVDPDDVLGSPDRIKLRDEPNTWLLDRLLTNQDWLRAPLTQRPPLPTAVAFSIKGGVGRTTAFALWAWHLARQGRNILLVDLDLEAPGLGSLLLEKDALPDFGLVDWLVESLSGSPGEELLRDCIADCPLALEEAGTIRILPAVGKSTQNYVGKLGRVYMPTLGSDDRFIGLAERLALLLAEISALNSKPDIVLLDARAGLHDIGSAVVTRLGAEVFMFARDDAQSWMAYRQLFRHLRNAHSVRFGMPDEDLRWRLKMVGSQLEVTESAERRFADASYGVWADELYDEGESPSLADDAPHSPAVIYFDPRVKALDLINPEQRPAWQIVETAFGKFFEDAEMRTLGDMGD